MADWVRENPGLSAYGISRSVLAYRKELNPEKMMHPPNTGSLMWRLRLLEAQGIIYRKGNKWYFGPGSKAARAIQDEIETTQTTFNLRKIVKPGTKRKIAMICANCTHSEYYDHVQPGKNGEGEKGPVYFCRRFPPTIIRPGTNKVSWDGYCGEFDLNPSA